MKLEKDFQTQFSKWLKYCYTGNVACELKLTKEDSLPFSAVKDHQVASCLAAKHSSIVYKIPDVGFQNPLDCFRMECSEAYIVIMYAEPRKKEFVMIDIDVWESEKKTSVRKSLTESRAKEIGKTFSLKRNPSHQPSL